VQFAEIILWNYVLRLKQIRKTTAAVVKLLAWSLGELVTTHFTTVALLGGFQIEEYALYVQRIGNSIK